MKILSLLACSPPSRLIGGAERQMHDFHKDLLKSGVSVDVLADSRYVGMGRSIIDGVRVYGVPFPRLTNRAVSLKNILLIARLLFFLLYTLIVVKKVDVIQVTTFRQPAFLAYLLSFVFRAPVVVRLACSGENGDFEFIRKNWLTRWAFRYVTPRIKKIVALDEETKKEALESGLSSEKIVIIPNAIIVDDFLDKQAIQVESEKKYILYVGRLSKTKKVNSLVEAYVRLSDNVEWKKFVRLVIVGDGEDLQNIENSINNPRFKRDIQLEGFKENVEPFLRGACCFVNPSVSEGMPNAVLEACAFGIPPILSDIPIHRVIARQVGMEDYLFPVEDVAALKESLSHFMGLSVSQRMEMRVRAYEFSLEYSREKRNKSYLDLYESLAGC